MNFLHMGPYVRLISDWPKAVFKVIFFFFLATDCIDS